MGGTQDVQHFALCMIHILQKLCVKFGLKLIDLNSIAISYCLMYNVCMFVYNSNLSQF